MKIQSISTALILSCSLHAFAVGNLGDSASGFAKQKIVQRLQIKKISDLNFGEASPGDSAKSIPPGFTENSENASFEVNGEPFRIYQIILPANDSVKMVNGSGGFHKEILIKSFASFPNRGGIIGPSGRAMIYVGGAREAISPRQAVGDYLGQFYVTVVY